MSDCFIYVIGRKEGPVKVGITSNLGARLLALRTGCPFPISILHAWTAKSRQHALKHEADFHAVYADRRLEGEWFDMDADLAREGVETSFEIEAVFDKREIEGDL